MEQNNSGGITALVAIVAIIVIVGLAYVLLQNATRPETNTPPSDAMIELHLGDTSSRAN